MDNKKIHVTDQWTEKFLRETPFMPFGSLCNLIGQAYRGKGITELELEALANKAFELSQKFVIQSYEKVTQEREVKDIPIN